MKKIILTLIAAAIGYCIAYTQPCLPEGIYFLTQEEIDNFQTNYPGCTEIEGNVTISDYGSGNITNLNGLSGVTSIDGNLIIGAYMGGGNPNLTSIAGLESLTSIGGDLELVNNPALTSLFGLESLTSIVGDLQICTNALTSLTGLESLTDIGSNLQIGLCGTSGSGNSLLISLTGLESLTSIGGELVIYNNEALTSLSGLESLISCEYLVIEYNDNLTSLTGLENIIGESITGLDFHMNSSLSTCDVQSVCDYLAAPNATVQIYENAAGCNSQIEVEEACGFCLPGGISFTTQEQIDNFQTNYPGCTEIDGYVTINGNDINNLSGLDILTSIGEDFWIQINNSLSNLSGLENLTSIGGDLHIFHNDALNSLYGLENIAAGSISNLYIQNNVMLSTCDVLSICQYLANPNGTIEIHDNATGCDSQEEVETHCQTTMKEQKQENTISITPNPSNDKINISIPAITGNAQLSIFAVSGEKVLERQLSDTETQIDISALPRGVYFVRVQNEKLVKVVKIVKE